jgi:hypothetical protein
MGLFGKSECANNNKQKFGPKTVDYVFLMYAFTIVCYIFLIINYGVSDMNIGTIMESRDTLFLE